MNVIFVLLFTIKLTSICSNVFTIICSNVFNIMYSNVLYFWKASNCVMRGNRETNKTDKWIVTELWIHSSLTTHLLVLLVSLFPCITTVYESISSIQISLLSSSADPRSMHKTVSSRSYVMDFLHNQVYSAKFLLHWIHQMPSQWLALIFQWFYYQHIVCL